MKKFILPLILILILTFTLMGYCNWRSGYTYRKKVTITGQTGAERVRIDHNGNVGIGTTSPGGGVIKPQMTKRVREPIQHPNAPTPEPEPEISE